VQRDGSEVVVAVEDNGVGIPAHLLPNIFEMFTQADRSPERGQGGLGVGLTIVKRLVEMHGGRVEARSGGRGMGSQFIVRLPVVLSLAREEQSPGRPEPASPRSGRRILVVDDNRDAALTLAMILNTMGHDTQTAYDGLEALDVATVFKPDVVLLDIGMPKLSGYDACRRLRQHPAGKDALVVAVTGWGQEADRRRSDEAGFDFHLVKPVDCAAIEGLLQRSAPKKVS
jgi:CheY-like chemotaxis protein